MKLDLAKALKKALTATSIIGAMSLFMNVKLVLFLVLAVGLNTYLALLQMKISMPSDFEISTLSAVIGTAAFGLTIGMIAAITTKLVAMILRGKIILDNVFQILSYCLAAYLTFLLPIGNVMTLAFIAMLAANASMFIVSHYLLQVSVVDNLIYTGSNLMGNIVFISLLAGPVFFLVR